MIQYYSKIALSNYTAHLGSKQYGLFYSLHSHCKTSYKYKRFSRKRKQYVDFLQNSFILITIYSTCILHKSEKSKFVDKINLLFDSILLIRRKRISFAFVKFENSLLQSTKYEGLK